MIAEIDVADSGSHPAGGAMSTAAGSRRRACRFGADTGHAQWLWYQPIPLMWLQAVTWWQE